MRIAFLIILAAGCGGTSDSHRTPNEYTGCAQDEQFRLFDDSEVAVTVDDTQSPQITQPDITATIPYSPKPIFQWNQIRTTWDSATVTCPTWMGSTAATPAARSSTRAR